MRFLAVLILKGTKKVLVLYLFDFLHNFGLDVRKQMGVGLERNISGFMP